jgi:two-component sensor histidine kinase
VGRFQSFGEESEQFRTGKPEPLRNRLAREVRARPDLPILYEVGIGVVAGLIAVAIRLALPLKPNQLPTLPAVVVLAIVTTFVGRWAGIATAVVGGLLSWYFLFSPFTWSLSHDAWIPILAFAVIATVIITTAHLYRSTARLSHERDMARLQTQADDAELFAREMAHRLKNALAIVQAIAFQTIGTATEDATKFAGRLKALADANDLLNEHVDTPSASVRQVIENALHPFRDFTGRFEIDDVESAIPAQQVVSLALALHELATNAMKYGALSEPDGRVSIGLLDQGDRVTMTWKEHGGPAVVAPLKAGFGSRLLRRSGMSTQLDFEPDGLRCVIGLRKV